jgi:cytochrome c oxidase assembly protein subunit 11
MPVTFFVAPEILEDDEAYDTQEITLSYTFHVMDITEDLAALSGTTE